MPQHEAKFSVNAAPGEVWRFIRDVESLCACIPGVERVKLVDGRTAELTVKEKVGVVPLVVDLTATIDAEEPPHRLHATAKAEHLTMEIELSHPWGAAWENRPVLVCRQPRAPPLELWPKLKLELNRLKPIQTDRAIYDGLRPIVLSYSPWLRSAVAAPMVREADRRS